MCVLVCSCYPRSGVSVQLGFVTRYCYQCSVVSQRVTTASLLIRLIYCQACIKLEFHIILTMGTQLKGRIVKKHHHSGLKHKNNYTRWLCFYVHQPTKPLILGKTSSLRCNNQSQVFNRERWKSLFSTLGPSLNLQDQGHQNSQADPQRRVLQPSKHAPRQTQRVHKSPMLRRKLL